MVNGENASASSEPQKEPVGARAINEGDEGDEGDLGDEGDEGDEGGDTAEFAETIEMIEMAEILEFVEAELATAIITESAAEIIFEIVIAILFMLSEVDDPSWINDPSRRNTVISELRPLVEDFTSRGVAPSATELRVVRDRIRARWRE